MCVLVDNVVPEESSTHEVEEDLTHVVEETQDHSKEESLLRDRKSVFPTCILYSITYMCTH